MKKITVSTKKAVINALENPQYKWRTIHGIAEEVGFEETEILGLIKSLAEEGVLVRASTPDKSGRELFTTREHYRMTESFINRFFSTTSDIIK